MLTFEGMVLDNQVRHKPKRQSTSSRTINAMSPERHLCLDSGRVWQLDQEIRRAAFEIVSLGNNSAVQGSDWCLSYPKCGRDLRGRE
jgi:hypothetical protein